MLLVPVDPKALVTPLLIAGSGQMTAVGSLDFIEGVINKARAPGGSGFIRIFVMAEEASASIIINLRHVIFVGDSFPVEEYLKDRRAYAAAVEKHLADQSEAQGVTIPLTGNLKKRTFN